MGKSNEKDKKNLQITEYPQILRELFEKLQISSLEHFDTEIAPLYGDLPYHNFEHAHQVLDHTLLLCDRCHRYNIDYDIQALYFAALFHDAGYHQDHTALGYETKEHYAAALATDFLTTK